MAGECLAQRASNAEFFPFDDIIMSHLINGKKVVTRKIYQMRIFIIHLSVLLHSVFSIQLYSFNSSKAC